MLTTLNMRLGTLHADIAENIKKTMAQIVDLFRIKLNLYGKLISIILSIVMSTFSHEETCVDIRVAYIKNTQPKLDFKMKSLLSDCEKKFKKDSINTRLFTKEMRMLYRPIVFL
jgi:hypothetical protein